MSERAEEIVDSLGEGDLLLALISGGASALLDLPAAPVVDHEIVARLHQVADYRPAYDPKSYKLTLSATSPPFRAGILDQPSSSALTPRKGNPRCPCGAYRCIEHDGSAITV